MTLFDKVPGHYIRRCRQITTAVMLEELQPFNLTAVQYAALIAAKQNPGLDQRTLGEVISLDRSTIGSLLGRLEKDGWVRREMPENNQRMKRVFVTPACEAVLDQCTRAVEHAQERFMQALDGDEQVEFMRLLKKLVKGNEDYLPAAKGR